MKKILFACLLVCSSFLTVNAQRFTPLDPSTSSLSYRSFTKVLNRKDSIAPLSFATYCSFNITATDTIGIRKITAKKWDQVTIELICDTLTAGRTVYFLNTSTSPVFTTVTGSNITVKKSKKALIVFLFDGVAWIEESRSIQF